MDIHLRLLEQESVRMSIFSDLVFCAIHIPPSFCLLYFFDMTGTTNFWPYVYSFFEDSIGRLVLLGCGIAAYTPATYLRCSLQRPLYGNLILRLASYLDAFSTYLIQTWLPSGAPGGTTGTPEVCPTRSSRTSVRASQISCAHNR